jgi:hypothetical protein
MLTVTVTAGDIARGERDDGSRCPIALAAGRAGIADPFAGQAYIGTDEAESDDGCYPVYDLPAEARQFIGDFDNERPVAPFTFTARLGWQRS